eukprot:GHVN01099983.1.p1 GENE.GHVN01099983.1~~GHVN01099983.1.p1  ORF type:complete len:413 (-),score=55.39 GHVN01099983.1:246-1484(-)
MLDVKLSDRRNDAVEFTEFSKLLAEAEDLHKLITSLPKEEPPLIHPYDVYDEGMFNQEQALLDSTPLKELLESVIPVVEPRPTVLQTNGAASSKAPITMPELLKCSEIKYVDAVQASLSQYGPQGDKVLVEKLKEAITDITKLASSNPDFLTAPNGTHSHNDVFSGRLWSTVPAHTNKRSDDTSGRDAVLQRISFLQNYAHAKPASQPAAGTLTVVKESPNTAFEQTQKSMPEKVPAPFSSPRSSGDLPPADGPVERTMLQQNETETKRAVSCPNSVPETTLGRGVGGDAFGSIEPQPSEIRQGGVSGRVTSKGDDDQVEENMKQALLDLVEKMQQSAVEYSEVLAKDNDRLSRTLDTQSRLLDRTEAAHGGARSLLWAKNMSFLCTMVLLMTGAGLFLATMTLIIATAWIA